MATAIKNNISIPKIEYLRLKNLDRRFNDFLDYFENIAETREARKEVKSGKVISQEKLFKRFGFK